MFLNLDIKHLLIYIYLLTTISALKTTDEYGLHITWAFNTTELRVDALI